MSRTIVITGTASGFGKLSVERFAAEGWNVVATVRKESDLHVHHGQPNVRTLLLDVDDEGVGGEVAEPDVVLVPGGIGTRALMSDDEMLSWIGHAHAHSKWTTSVCTGSLLLAAAGVLEGLEATTHWLSLETLARYGAKPVQRRVVEQGKVITAAGVSAGIDMALTLATRIAGDDVAQAIQLAIEYDPEPPFNSGSTKSAPERIVEIVRDAASPTTAQR